MDGGASTGIRTRIITAPAPFMTGSHKGQITFDTTSNSDSERLFSSELVISNAGSDLAADGLVGEKIHEHYRFIVEFVACRVEERQWALLRHRPKLI